MPTTKHPLPVTCVGVPPYRSSSHYWQPLMVTTGTQHRIPASGLSPRVVGAHLRLPPRALWGGLACGVRGSDYRRRTSPLRKR